MKRITRSRAIKEFCKTCFGCDEWYGGKVGTTKDMAIKMVRECESEECPLYNFRTGVDTTPQRKKLIPTERQKAVRNRLKTIPRTKGDSKSTKGEKIR